MTAVAPGACTYLSGILGGPNAGYSLFYDTAAAAAAVKLRTNFYTPFHR